MEKADNVFVIPASFGWSDLGTWASLWNNYNPRLLGQCRERQESHDLRQQGLYGYGTRR